RARIKLQYLIQQDNSDGIQPYREFLQLLREDILDYGTLSDYTLRRIANFKTNYKNEAEYKQLIDEIKELYNELGENYLLKEKYKSDGLQKEIIIAIENKKIQEAQ
ncbi:MAG: hypothetical protein WBK20_14075, partial [Spirochaetota bacterium]